MTVCLRNLAYFLILIWPEILQLLFFPYRVKKKGSSLVDPISDSIISNIQHELFHKIKYMQYKQVKEVTIDQQL